MKLIPILFFLLAFCDNLNAQILEKNIEKIKSSALLKESLSDDTSGSAKFLTYPTLAYTPETKWEFGVANLFLFHAKKNHQNRLNEIYSFTFYTQQRQYGIWLDHAIYTDQNNWFFLGRGRFQFFPLKYYGIGANTPNNYAIVSNGNIQIRERALRKVKENFYVGLEVDYHKIFDVSYDLSKVGGDFELPQGSNGSSNKALGIGIVYDDRKNVLNVRKGMFAELAFLQYAKAFNSDFQFQLFQFDARIFRRGFAKNQVIAIQSNGMSNVGNVPFNQMALIGGESMMRGYYLGRFRDKTMVNLQAEYRFLPLPFSKKLGATLFSSIGNVAPSVQSLNISNTKFAAGLGLRYLVFKAKDIYFRTDLAFTNEGRGFYVFLGEAF
jgi:hypothetical protein